MKTTKPLYPYEAFLAAERKKKPIPVTAPDFIGGKPNYEKFKGWSTEDVLVWLNID